jgi:uncharacterized protein
MLCAAIALSAGVAFADLPPLPGWFGFEQLVERQPHGPAFDCALATLKAIERHICANPRLGRLDQTMNDAYGDVLLESFHALSLAADQAVWLRERDRCITDACIARAYRSRIAVLGRESAETERRMKTETVRTPFVASTQLRARLAKIAGEACFGVDALVDVGDGRASLLAHTCGACLPTDHALIFHPEGDGYRLIFREPQCYVSGLFTGFQDERSHGLRRIETFSRSAAGDHYADFFDYDGRVYRHVGTVEQYAAQNDHRRAFVSIGDGTDVEGNQP